MIVKEKDWHNQTLKKKDSLYVVGNPASSVFRLLEGVIIERVPAFLGKSFSMLIPKDAYFGLDALVSEERLTSIVALEPAEVQWCNTGEFRDMLESHPEAFIALFQSLVGRNYQLSMRLAIKAYGSVKLEVSRALIEYMKSIEEPGFNISRANLSELVGSSAKTTIRMLSDFLSRGIITEEDNNLSIQDYEHLRKIPGANNYLDVIDQLYYKLVSGTAKVIQRSCSRQDRRLPDTAQERREQDLGKWLDRDEGRLIGRTETPPREIRQNRISNLDSIGKIWLLMCQGVRPDVISQVIGEDISLYLQEMASKPFNFPPVVVREYFARYEINIIELNPALTVGTTQRLSSQRGIDIDVLDPSSPIPIPEKRSGNTNKEYIQLYQTIQIPSPELINLPRAIDHLKAMLSLPDFDSKVIFENARRLGLWELVYPSNQDVSFKTGTISNPDARLALGYIKSDKTPEEIEELTRCRIGPLMRKLIYIDLESVSRYSDKYFSSQQQAIDNEVPNSSGEKGTGHNFLSRLKATGRGNLTGYPGGLSTKLEELLDKKQIGSDEFLTLARKHAMWEALFKPLDGVLYKSCAVSSDAFDIALDMIKRNASPEEIERETSYRIGKIIRKIIKERSDLSDLLGKYEDTYFVLKPGICPQPGEGNKGSGKRNSLREKIISSIRNGTEFDFEGRPYRNVGQACVSILNSGNCPPGMGKFIIDNELWECYYLEPEQKMTMGRLTLKEIEIAKSLVYDGVDPREIERTVSHRIGSVIRELRAREQTDQARVDIYKAKYLKPA